MQASPCKACDSIGQQELFMHKGYPVCQCQACGLVFLNPQPSDEALSSIYSAEYFLESTDAESQEHFSQIKRRTARLYLDAIAQYGGARKGALLEVGCGKGDLLAEGLARGYEVHGLDLSPHAAQAANHRLGRDVVTCATIEQASLPANYFDVCICADVIEHTRDPIEFLAQVRQVMKPDGVLLLVTPTLDSWSARVMKHRWFEFKTEHLYYFNTVTLQNALARTGFQSVEITPARKVLSLDYIHRHFQRYPVPAVSPLLSLLWHLSPEFVQNMPFSVSTGSLLALARPAVRRARPLVSVIMPVYNEHKTVTTVLDTLIAKELKDADKEIIIAEGNSSDGTRDDVLRYRDAPGVQLVLLDRNRGKGYAVRQGLRHAKGDIILIQDADLEYDIDDYDDLIEPLRTYRQAFVLGSRHSGSHKIRVFANQRFLAVSFNLGHVLLTKLFNLLYAQRLNDPWTMYKVFRRDCLHKLKFECCRFNFDVELLSKLVRKGFEPVEIPVRYKSRSFKEGKKIKVLIDPWTWIWACIKYRIVSPYESERAVRKP